MSACRSREQVVAVVDVFTMSCRALGRGVEHKLLARLAEEAETTARCCGREEALQGADECLCSHAAQAQSSAAGRPCAVEGGRLMLVRCQGRPKQGNLVCSALPQPSLALSYLPFLKPLARCHASNAPRRPALGAGRVLLLGIPGVFAGVNSGND